MKFLILLLSLFSFMQCRSETCAVLRVPVNSGFFAIFNSVLGLLAEFEEGGYEGVKVDLNSGFYLDPHYGPNWWNYYFEPLALGIQEAPFEEIDGQKVQQLIDRGLNLERSDAHHLIQKYVKIMPGIQADVDTFVKSFFEEYFVIGVHHRGTDKVTEAKIISYQRTFNELNWLLAQLPEKLIEKTKIFVATDEEDFLQTAKELYPSLIIHCNFTRSRDCQPLHYQDGLYQSNYEKGKEALLDCLFLSRCDWLFFPASSALSRTAIKFNPRQMAIALIEN
ncbi:MAG: nodulation protein NodZ [Parachlamydia sp.]|nr:nodulation protein NodZ [Parachlamydia sp.]